MVVPAAHFYNRHSRHPLLWPIKKALSNVSGLFDWQESGKASSPEEIVRKAQERRSQADDTVHEGIAEGIGCHAQ